MIKKVVIIGSGNIAWHFAHNLPLFGYCVVQIFDRDAHKAEALSMEIGAEHTSDYSQIYDDANFYIYAVSDDAIAEVIDLVKIDCGIHLHTSGSTDIDVFENKKSNYGVLYPLQTFIRNKKIDLSKVAIFIEANNDNNLEEIKKLSKKISLKTFFASSYQRKQLHLSAVFASNFSNYLWQTAFDIVKGMNLPFNDVILPLIQESVDKLKYMTPQQAQTGPAARGDINTINKHLEMLADDKDMQHLYLSLSELIKKQNN